MKFAAKLFLFIACLFAASAFGGGLTVSTTNGFATGLNAVNGKFSGDSSGLSLANEGTNGIADTNAFVRGEWFANQGESICRTPPLGIASWYGSFNVGSWTNIGAVVGVSNALYWATRTDYAAGYRYMQLDDGWGATNLDANNLMQLNPGLAFQFGSGTAGVSNFFAAIHTNGWKIGVYYDGGTNLSSGNLQHGMGGYLLWTNFASLGRYGLDALKSDQSLFDKERLAGIIAANGYPIFLHGAVQFSGTDGPLIGVVTAFMNGWRSVSGGDITSYSQLIRWCDVVMTNNWWVWVRPGHFIDMDYIGGEGAHGGLVAAKTHFIIDALFSAPIWDDTALGATAPLNVVKTNAALLAINQDPAVICAQRYIQTNNCDVYLKPLGSPNGPQFALGVVNRDQANSQTVSLMFTNLPPLYNQQHWDGCWSAYDCVSNTGWVLNGSNGFTVTLGTNDSILWQIVPGFALQTNVVAANFPDSEIVNVVSNGTPYTFYQSWDTDASNYVARAGLTNQTEILCAAQAVALGKTHGWWNKLDCLYLFMGSSSNSTAQNLLSSNYGVKWSASGVTYAWNGVTGNGSTGYGDTQFNPSTATGPHFTQSGASVFVYNQSPTMTVNNGALIGTKNTTWAGMVCSSGATPVFTAEGLNFANFGIAINAAVDGITGNATGPWCIIRNEAQPILSPNGNYYTNTFYHSFQSGAGDESASTGVPTSDFFVLANDNSGAANFQGCTLSAAAIGGAFGEQQYVQFLTDINVIENMRRQKIP